jgi:hypothetical protein
MLHNFVTGILPQTILSCQMGLMCGGSHSHHNATAIRLPLWAGTRHVARAVLVATLWRLGTAPTFHCLIIARYATALVDHHHKQESCHYRCPRATVACATSNTSATDIESGRMDEVPPAGAGVAGNPCKRNQSHKREGCGKPFPDCLGTNPSASIPSPQAG